MRKLYMFFDVEITGETINKDKPKGKYLVNGWSEDLWTDSLDEALSYLKETVLKFEKEIKVI